MWLLTLCFEMVAAVHYPDTPLVMLLAQVFAVEIHDAFVLPVPLDFHPHGFVADAHLNKDYQRVCVYVLVSKQLIPAAVQLVHPMIHITCVEVSNFVIE